MYKNGVFFAIILILNVSCATHTKKQCQDLDWVKVGLAQAYEGIDYEEGFSYYYVSCTQKNNVEINKKEFQEGYQYGLSQFCDPSNAVIWGLEGKKYKGICPKKKERRFMASYTKGYNKYLSNRVENLSGTVQSLEDEINRLKKEITLKNTRIKTLETRKSSQQSNL